MARLAVAQLFSLGIAMQDSMENRVPFTEEVWAELHPHLRLQISATGETGEARDIPLTGSCALEGAHSLHLVNFSGSPRTDGVARVMDLVLNERHGTKQLRLTDRRDPPQLAEATLRFPLSIGPPELLYMCVTCSIRHTSVMRASVSPLARQYPRSGRDAERCRGGRRGGGARRRWQRHHCARSRRRRGHRLPAGAAGPVDFSVNYA